MKRFHRHPVAGLLFHSLTEAQAWATSRRIELRGDDNFQVHIFTRAVRAGGYSFRVYAVVVQRVSPVVQPAAPLLAAVPHA